MSKFRPDTRRGMGTIPGVKDIDWRYALAILVTAVVTAWGAYALWFIEHEPGTTAAPGTVSSSYKSEGAHAEATTDVQALSHRKTGVSASRERGLPGENADDRTVRQSLAAPGRTSGAGAGPDHRSIRSNVAPRGRSGLPDRRSRIDTHASDAAGETRSTRQHDLDDDDPSSLARSTSSIAGRVLDEFGAPIVGIGLIASPIRLFDRPDDNVLPASGLQANTQSGSDGRYAFDAIPHGEYRIQSVATQTYPSRQLIVRAGIDFADLILTRQHALAVSGIISGPRGEPLANVLVMPLAQGASGVYTDNTGAYSMMLQVSAAQERLAIRLRKHGFRQQDVYLSAQELAAGQHVAMDAILDPIVQNTVVTGSLTTTEGAPLSNRQIHLSSVQLRQSYRARSDVHGQFSIPGVEIGEDYRLTVRAGDGYAGLIEDRLSVPTEGLNLALVLPEEDTGSLAIRLVNLGGAPVAGFGLLLRSDDPTQNAKSVVSDANGYFAVSGAPAGRLTFQTQSDPRFQISGIELPTGGNASHTLVLDTGVHEIRGYVADANGMPVAVSRIVLKWSHEYGGIRSNSSRTTAADAYGSFRFSGLDSGPYTLSLQAPGYEPVQIVHEPDRQGYEVRVSLEAKAPQNMGI